MRDVWNDVFSDNDCQKETLAVATVSNLQDESFASISLIQPTVLPVSIASPTEVSPRVSLLNIDDYQTNKKTNPCDAITQDLYMPTEAMTPVSVIEFPQSVNSHQHHDLDVTMPLTSILNELPMQSIDESPIEITPVASPVNKHAKCDDPFCCQHETDEFACPSVNTIDIDSNQSSPMPTALIRNRGKKRPQKHEDWSDVKRKNLMNQRKTYCSKKGRTVEAKLMGPACHCKFKCVTKISEEERIEIFGKFWELGEREKQWLHIVNYTKKQNKTRTFQRVLKHNRVYTYKYYLPKKMLNIALTTRLMSAKPCS